MIGRPPLYIAIRVATVLLVSGCAQPDVSASPTPAGTASGSAPIAMELEATGENLPAGIYTRTGFEPQVTFDLDGSWQAVQLGSGFFDVQQQAGTPGRRIGHRPRAAAVDRLLRHARRPRGRHGRRSQRWLGGGAGRR